MTSLRDKCRLQNYKMLQCMPSESDASFRTAYFLVDKQKIIQKITRSATLGSPCLAKCRIFRQSGRIRSCWIHLAHCLTRRGDEMATSLCRCFTNSFGLRGREAARLLWAVALYWRTGCHNNTWKSQLSENKQIFVMFFHYFYTLKIWHPVPNTPLHFYFCGWPKQTTSVRA